jgi:hypothetical protein
MAAGRQFIVDENGRAKAVVLTIQEYRDLLERLGDAEDLGLIEQRRGEPDILVSSVDELNTLLSGD